MTKEEMEFQKAVLERLDKIISLLEKDKKTKKLLLEEGQYFGRQRANYPKDVYGGDTFYCSINPDDFKCSNLSTSIDLNSIDLNDFTYILNKED